MKTVALAPPPPIKTQTLLSLVWMHTQIDELLADFSIPAHATVAIIQREVLLTRAKLHYLVFEHLQQQRVLNTYEFQLKQVRLAVLLT